MAKLTILTILSLISFANALLMLIPNLPIDVVILHLMIATALPFFGAMVALVKQGGQQ